MSSRCVGNGDFSQASEIASEGQLGVVRVNGRYQLGAGCNMAKGMKGI